MKRWVLPVVFFCATHAFSQIASTGANRGPASACSVADEAAIRRISETWKDGYNSGDAAKVAALYASDAYYLTQHFVTGIVHPREKIQAYVQRGADARYHLDSIEILKLECSGDFAYIVSRYESTNAGEKAFGVNIVVLRKIAAQWLIVAHESAVPDPAAAIQSLDQPANR